MITLRTDDGRTTEVTGTVARVGRDPQCELAFPGRPEVRPVHAQFRRLGDRWLVEGLEGSQVFVGGNAERLFWLSAGDEVRLTPQGPAVTFQPCSARGVNHPAAAVPTVDSERISPRAPADHPPSPEGNAESEATSTHRPAWARIPWESMRRPAATYAMLAALTGLMAIGFAWKYGVPAGGNPPSDMPAPGETTLAVEPEVAPEPPVAREPAPELESTNDDSPPVVADPAPAAPERLSPFDPWQASEAVVWLGYEFEGEIFATETGWAIAPEWIVGSAKLIAFLELLAASEQYDYQIIVCQGEKYYDVVEFRTPAQYDLGEPAVARSLAHNVGLVRLNRPLPLAMGLELAPDDETKNWTAGQSLRALGFENPLAITDPYDSLRVRQVVEDVTVQAGGSAGRDGPMFFRVQARRQRGLDGAPVFNAAGQVVGVLSLADDPAQTLASLALAWQLRSLLEND